MDPILVEELVSTLSQETPAVPLWEVVLFVVLSAITYYRKQLSSNRVYMDHHSHNQKQQEEMAEVEGWVGEHKSSSPPPEPAAMQQSNPIDRDEQEDEPPTHIMLENAIKGIPLNLHAKLKNMQVTLIRAMAIQANLDDLVLSGPHVEEEDRDLLTSLPQDGLLQVTRFLQPQDVLQLCQTSRGLRDICGRPEVWKEKWLTRFGSLWESPLATEIFTRRHLHIKANQVQVKDWKRFYFEFEQGWMDWLLAGYNTEERCLVGLHGEVYDLTSFLDIHPGSKETIMVNAGSDATSFFEDVGHSNQARALMRDFMVLAPCPAVSRCLLQSVALAYSERKKALEQRLSNGVAEGVEYPHCKQPVCQACDDVTYSLLPYESTPCEGGRHVGLCHGVCDAMTGHCHAWWSCCGLVVPEDA